MRKRWVSRRGFLAGSAAAGLVLASGPRPLKAAEKVVVRVDFAPWGIHGALHLAQVNGWFEEAGLDVEIQDGKGTLDTIQLVGAGRVEVGQVQLGPMAVARENELPVKSFAGFARRSDLAVLVDRETGPDTAEGLEGLKLSCFTASPWAPFIDPFLEASGLSRDSVDVVMVSPPAMVSTYASGEADGFMSLAPFGPPLVEDTRPAKPILAIDKGIVFPSYGLIATEETISESSDKLAKLAEVQIRAWEYIFDGHVDEAVQAIIDQRPNADLNPDTLHGQMAAYEDFFVTEATAGLGYGVQSDEDWEMAIASMEEADVISEGHTPEEYYTNDLLT